MESRTAKIRLFRRVSALLLMSTAFFWIVIVDRSQNASLNTAALRALAAVPKRPVIHTFQERIVDNNDVLHIWQKEWTQQGWDVRVLTLEDAMSHQHFETLEKVVGEVMPFGHREAKMGYYRFLAMVQAGGGWLADANVLPLWPLAQSTHSSNEFTVRCSTIRRAHSCLLSGSKDEWDRMAIELMGSVQRNYASRYLHPNKAELDFEVPIPAWTDDLALDEIVSFAHPRGRPAAKRTNQVLTFSQASQMRLVGSQCEEATDKIAVQLESNDEQAMRQWLSQWKKDCLGNNQRANRTT